MYLASTDLDSGQYSLNLTDDNGCIFDTTFILLKPNSIITNAQVNLVTCFGNVDGVINLNTSGGNGSYNWNWSGPNGYTSTDDTITALDTGQYQLSIVDANLCQKDTVFK